MRTKSIAWTLAVGCMAALIVQPALADNLKVTPLGGRTMEFDGGGKCMAGC
jgi:hypothetical protein